VVAFHPGAPGGIRPGRDSSPRKKDGKLVERDPKELNFRSEASLRSMPHMEKVVVDKLVTQKLINV
jgi:hypothetical protein